MRVAKLSDIPESGALGVSVGDDQAPLGLFRRGDEVFAMDDRCPHAGSRLSSGRVCGTVVTCALHFWDFDVRTGLPPGTSDGRALACYPVRIDGDDVFVEIGEEASAHD